MQVVFHIGAHATDNGKLLKSLFRNKGVLQKQGVIVTGPSRYRELLQQTVLRLDGAVPSKESREVLLDAIIDDDHPERIILSNDNFICFAQQVFEDQLLYAATTERIMALCNLFPDDQVEFHLALCNPATFIPMLHKLTPKLTIEQLLRGTDPLSLRWSHMVRNIREAAPDAGLTVWCNEDTPLIWVQLMHEAAGLEAHVKLNGAFDLLSEIMSREGMRRFRSYLKSHPPQTEIQKRRIMSAFLDKFAMEEAIEEELDVPGWTDELVAQLTDAYEEDIYAIQRMPGVNFIAP